MPRKEVMECIGVHGDWRSAIVGMAMDASELLERIAESLESIDSSLATFLGSEQEDAGSARMTYSAIGPKQRPVASV